ncbi:sensor histidine kinase [Alicyclobacillus fodiniaquatilis]|uniref:histidine kinase n=1 Tax=Alicyclobacillus fodiniaquatilis TaxID=1661150 RepID=A0ABW4JJE6_9BACL
MSRFHFRTLRSWMAPKSLRYQLLSRSLLILAGLFLLIGVFQYVLMSRFLYQNTAQTIRNQVGTMPFQMWTQSGPNRLPPFVFATPGSTVSFIDQQGNLHVLIQPQGDEAVPHLSQQTYEAALTYGQHGGQYQIVRGDNGHKELVVLAPVGPHGQPAGIVQVSTDLRQLQHVLMRQLLIFVVLALIALMVGLLTFSSTLRRTLVPLSQMYDSVRRVDAGNMDERVVPDKAQSEIALLANSFNSMLERLSVSFAAERAAKHRLRQFVADASHELRTPLTSIRGFIEVLLRQDNVPADQLQSALKSMLGESERLTKLVEDLLLLAKLDREQALELTEARMDLVIAQMEDQLRLLAGDREVVLVLDVVHARFDRDKMKQVLFNLFQNAVQHTSPETGRIGVSLVQAEGVYLTVRDNGHGIAPEHKDKLFERFYRADAARSRQQGGAGLGLAITKSIVAQHGGTIACESELGRGTTFTVWLPNDVKSHSS